MTSISDIAKKAGVAKSTVSRVINHHPYVSDETLWSLSLNWIICLISWLGI